MSAESFGGKSIHEKQIRSQVFADKGFYIALILCLAIIGVGTWAVVEFTDVGESYGAIA